MSSCALKRSCTFESPQRTPLAHLAPASIKRCKFLSPPAVEYHVSGASSLRRKSHGSFIRQTQSSSNPQFILDSFDATPHDHASESSSSVPVEHYLPPELARRRKKLMLKKEKENSSSATQLIPEVPPSQQVTLTLQQVQGIVDKAVRQREEELRAEFNQTLASKLEEQYNQFSKFNQDYIHRRMDESTFSYMS